MLAMCRCFLFDRCILTICSSVACVFMLGGIVRFVKIISFLMYVMSTPPVLWVLSVHIGV